jgi:hypothetical protein
LARTLRGMQREPGTGLRPARRCVSSKAEKITARALGRVLARNVAAGRAVEFPELLRETAAELAAMHKQLKRDARMLGRARKQVREAQLRIAAGELSRVSVPGDVEREFRDLDIPLWHPEHPGNDLWSEP